MAFPKASEGQRNIREGTWVKRQIPWPDHPPSIPHTGAGSYLFKTKPPLPQNDWTGQKWRSGANLCLSGLLMEEETEA